MFGRFMSAVATFTLLLSAALPAQAETIGTSVAMTGRMQQTLDSRINNVGDRFDLVLEPPYAASILHGATVEGHISALRRAGQGTNPYIHIAFDRIILANGEIRPIHAELLADQVVRDHHNLGRIAATTGGAALIGGLLGKGVGAAIGGGAGLLYSANYRDNINIPNGSTVRIITVEPLKL